LEESSQRQRERKKKRTWTEVSWGLVFGLMTSMQREKALATISIPFSRLSSSAFNADTFTV